MTDVLIKEQRRVAQDRRFSFLAGYAGSDFVEGLYKAKFQKNKKSLVAS